MGYVIRRLAALIALLACCAPGAQAGVFSEDPVAVKFHINGVVVSTAGILVDLSDTTNWPHKNTGAIDVAAINIQVDKVAASSGTIKIGVITRVDVSSGDVTWFYEHSFDRVAAGTEEDNGAELNGFVYRCKVANDGTTPYLASNDKTTNSQVYQTDLNLPSVYGNSKPGKGDIVVSYTTAGTDAALDLIVNLIYTSEWAL